VSEPPTEYAPPGWFPDPTGLQALRWWDGTQWGEETRHLPESEQEPLLPYQPQPSHGQPRPTRKSWPRRNRVPVVLGSLAALIIVIGGIASTSGNAKQAGNASSIAVTTPTGTATPIRLPTHHATSPEIRPKKVPVIVQAATPPPAATTPTPAATAPAASGGGQFTCGPSATEQQRHLLRSRQIRARCRPWGIRNSWRWGHHHLRRNDGWR
jgi:Protein of unknown function (DUF2510)